LLSPSKRMIEGKNKIIKHRSVMELFALLILKHKHKRERE